MSVNRNVTVPDGGCTDTTEPYCLSSCVGRANRMRDIATIKRSPITAMKVVAIRRWTSSSEPGASSSLNFLTHAWISLHRTAPVGRHQR